MSDPLVSQPAAPAPVERPAESPSRRARVIPSEAAAARVDGARAQLRAVEVYEAARARGYADGREAAAAEAAESLARRDFERGVWMRSIEHEIVDLVIRSVERVLGEAQDIDLVRRAAMAAAAELKGAGRVTLAVCPHDLPEVRRELDRLRQVTGAVEIAALVADPEIGAGAASLRASDAVVDARIETVLSGLRRALSAAMAPPTQARAAL